MTHNGFNGRRNHWPDPRGCVLCPAGVEGHSGIWLKETAMKFFSYVYEKPARKHFQWWYNWAVRSRFEPMKEKAAMLKRRFENIIT
jgi:hypothetical protein